MQLTDFLYLRLNRYRTVPMLKLLKWNIFFFFLEWQRGIEPHDDPALKGKKDPDSGE